MRSGINIQKLKASEPCRVTFGDWDRETVRLDWDNTPLDEVKYWSFKAYKRFKLEGFMILVSSWKQYPFIRDRGKVVCQFMRGSYLTVFDKPVRWETNVKVMDWVALESGNEGLKKYVLMQGIKGSSTVRLSRKGVKPFPEIVYCYGSQFRQIKQFLETRKIVLEVVKEIKA